MHGIDRLGRRTIGSVALAILATSSLARAATPDEVEVRALLQTWGTIVDQDEDKQADPAGYGDPEADPGLDIQRARIGLDGTHGPLWWDVTIGYAAPYDAVERFGGDSHFGLVDASGGWQWGKKPGEGTGFQLSAGLQHVPYLREELFSTQDLTFEERSVATQWLSPGHDVGLIGDLGLADGLRARVGVFNGNGNLDGDNNVGKLMVGRVEWSHGQDPYRTWSPKGDNVVSFALSGLSNSDVATSTLGFNADALVRIGHIGGWLALTQQTEKPTHTDVAAPDVLDGTTRRGATLQIDGFVPLGKDADSTEGLDIAGRVGLFDASTNAHDNGDVAIAHLGATWRDVTPGLDLGAGFIHRQELAGRTIPNDTVRVWAQIRARRSIGATAASSTTVANAWRKDFIGTWKAGGDLDGAVIAFWEQPGLGLVGSFQMTRPRGKVVVGRPYPLDSFMYADRTLRVRMDPYGEGRDVVWFELSPSADGTLCGYGYEDGRRADAVGGTGGGSWICWSTATSTPVPTAPTTDAVSSDAATP